jgi:DNA repair exonuclease SbcCD ATPase subunit
VISEELEKSVRREVDSYINSRLRGLQDEIGQLQGQINEAFTRLQERSSNAAQADNSVAFSISEYIRAAHERGIEDAASATSRVKSSSEIAILKAAIEDLDDQRSQMEILNTLVNRAASFAPRVAFFVIKNEQATGWRARGLEGTIGDDAIRQISFPLSTDTPISDVVHSRSVWSGSPGANA